MSGKLIALESTNQPLLDKTAKYLALKLQSEGHTVEVLSFPQKKQNSSHFVQSHQSGEYGVVNPYAASMFYILDRYDASPQIKHYLTKDVVVICKSYRGTTLAKLGAGISDAPTRKGFYIWADSLESGTFAVPRPDMAIVLSEELPTLYELCELFPKDYVFAIDPTKVRNIVNRIIPPAPAVQRRPKGHTVTWQQALKAAGAGAAYDFEPGKSYAVLSKKSKAQKQYASGLKELELLQEKAVKKLGKTNIVAAERLVTPIGRLGTTNTDEEPQKAYKNRVLSAQIAQIFEQTYGNTEPGAKILTASPRNELDVLAALVLPKTELGAGDVASGLNTMPITKKIELYKAYLAGVDNAPADYPLQGISATIATLVSYCDLEQLTKLIPSVKFSVQAASPRWGFDVPESLNAAIDEIEDCFASSLKLHGQLEALGEPEAAQNVVLGGHQIPTVITLDGAAIRTLAKNAANWPLATNLVQALADQYPLLTEL